jgi:drug/metabolite transporter (DMT)-like permease
VRRVSPVDVMLLATVVIWGLNTTSSRYLVTNGVHPLAYASTRYFLAIVLFAVFTWWRERSFRIARGDIPLVLLAGALIFCNQLMFVYAARMASASTVGLMLGTVPIYAAIIATLAGLERPGRIFWLAAAISFAGSGLIASGSGGGVSGSVLGNLLAVGSAITWAAYSVVYAPLLRRYSPFRISTVVLPVGWLPMALVSIPQLSTQRVSGFGWLVAVSFIFAVVGPLFLTNILWFTAIERVGLSRATLFSNLQPFFSVLFAVLLLSERLTTLEIAGGVAIMAGILIERFGARVSALVVAGE